MRVYPFWGTPRVAPLKPPRPREGLKPRPADCRGCWRDVWGEPRYCCGGRWDC